MKKRHATLLFVYNADSGLGNALLDSAHKVLDPSGYACSLCQLTYGLVKEKSRWKTFRENARLPMQFLHKNEYAQQYKEKTDFPVVFIEENQRLKPVISTEILNAMRDVEELILKVSEVLQQWDQNAVSP